MYTPDAIINVRFLTTSEGGRTTDVAGPIYACPLFVDEQGFDCRLLLEGKQLKLGNNYEVGVKFLNSDLALEKISVGTDFMLWEGRYVATGKIIRLPNSARRSS